MITENAICFSNKNLLNLYMQMRFWLLNKHQMQRFNNLILIFN